MRAWARRTAELHDELVALADTDPRWWLLAGGAAATEQRPARAQYVNSDAEPGTDTFLGYRDPAPTSVVADAITRARAARTALRELDGALPEQPLAVTMRRGADTDAELAPSALDAAAFAIGDGCLVARLDAPDLHERVSAFAAGARADHDPALTPFVCVSLGEDALEVARHGHRRAWTASGGPWLGLGRAGGLATVSTCHFVVDGYGHARLTARIAALATHATTQPLRSSGLPMPRLAAVPGAIPLGVAWRELATPVPRTIPMAYALGCLLHRTAGRVEARFSPTLQIPIAPGDRDDPQRRRRRVVPAVVSVRFDRGAPEPYAAFEARARAALAREASGHGLVTRLLAAARGAPAPLAWKRRTISSTRPRWLDRFAEVITGRACLSRIHVDAPLPPVCAVSSPARLAAPGDPLGGCVITLIDDGERAAVTACGSGLAGTTAEADALLDELLAVFDTTSKIRPAHG